MNYKDVFYELMDKIQNDINDNEVVYGYLSDINRLLSPILEQLDESDFYLWGLVHYSISSEPTENSMAKFKKSLQLNIDYYMSRLYLAHCYHDKKEWYDAIEEYLKVDQDKLSEDFPIWRTATLNEQIGYCYWQIGQKDDAIRFFERVSDLWNRYGLSEGFMKPKYMIDCLGPNHTLLEKIDISKMT